MRNFFIREDGMLDVMVGSDITRTLIEARDISRERAAAGECNDGELVVFTFNDVVVNVGPNSDLDLICRDWQRALSGYIVKAVGPNPNPALTDQEKESDARIEAVNESKRQQQQAKYDTAANQLRDATEAKLADAPPMEVSDAAAWQSYVDINEEGYGAAIIRYAERWARLMQIELANGSNLEDVADPTSHQADIEGITGAMHGAAVASLAKCWTHGDQLRKWHNKQWGISEDVKGTVNPAIIRLG